MGFASDRGVHRTGAGATEPGLEQWLELNRQYSEKWPNITSKKESPADADEFRDEKDKFKKYFSEDPGSGD